MWYSTLRSPLHSLSLSHSLPRSSPSPPPLPPILMHVACMRAHARTHTHTHTHTHAQTHTWFHTIKRVGFLKKSIARNVWVLNNGIKMFYSCCFHSEMLPGTNYQNPEVTKENKHTRDENLWIAIHRNLESCAATFQPLLFDGGNYVSAPRIAIECIGSKSSFIDGNKEGSC